MKRLVICLALLFVVASTLVYLRCRTLLFKPTCDPTPILTLKTPFLINSLSQCPRNATDVENGINKNSGRPQPDNVKEMFGLRREASEYNFTLFFNELAAKRSFESDIRTLSEHTPVFSRNKKNDIEFCLFFVEQPRTDPEGGCTPMRYYMSSALVRIHNLVITIRVFERKRNSDALSNSVKQLAEIVAAALQKEHRE